MVIATPLSKAGARNDRSELFFSESTLGQDSAFRISNKEVDI